jgi:hypothetical protein
MNTPVTVKIHTQYMFRGKSIVLRQNKPVFKKRPNFLKARQPAQRVRYDYWAHLAAGFDNKLPFALFRYEH